MDFKNKYLKYKNKYLQLKNYIGGIKNADGTEYNIQVEPDVPIPDAVPVVAPDAVPVVAPDAVPVVAPDAVPVVAPISVKKILLMFLGGTPDQENIINHYINMNTTFDNKNNFFIIIHPIKLPYIINSNFSKIFKPENIFIVNETHHIQTGWGTRSLVDATLLMMQYSHIKNNNNQFDKYILLSSSCCPLYNFDEIYKVLIKNNKSWLYGSRVKEIQNENDFLQPHPHAPFNFSQWMILDKVHVKYFFPDNNFGNTYEIQPETFNCINTQNINAVIGSIKLKEEKNINNTDLLTMINLYEKCNTSDELFFGNFILYKLYKNNPNPNKLDLKHFTDNIENILFSEIINKLKCFPVKILKQLNIQNKKNLKNISYLYPLILGNSSDIRNGRYDISDISKQIKIKNINIEFYDFDMNGADQFATNHILCKQTTFCDWFGMSVEPLNFLRNFNIIESFNINEYLNNKYYTTDIYTKINTLFNNKSCFDYAEPSNNKWFHSSILNTVSHPVEYSSWTFLNILNAFLLAIYFLCTLVDMPYIEDKWHKSNCAIYLAYQEIIFRELGINKAFKINYPDYNMCNQIIYSIYNGHSTADFIKDFYKEIQDKIALNPAILDKKFGNPITPDVLISALSTGTLFIRKCYNSSLIESYSHILKTYTYMQEDEPLNKVGLTKYNVYDYSKY